MVHARATEQYNAWKTESTEEQRSSALEKLNKYKNDEAYRTEH